MVARTVTIACSTPKGLPPFSVAESGTAAVHEDCAVALITECLQRDVGALAREAHDLCQLAGSVALQVMIGIGDDPVSVRARFVFEKGLPHVIRDAHGGDVVVQAPYQCRVDVAGGKRGEPTGFIAARSCRY